MTLPTPKGPRWQPLRSGLINLFHYADQQFWYEDGRLLLRGNNGTGKSRVLALQLPFLLDAQLTPTRMEPDRSPSKRPEWNLLLGGKHRNRLGYTWIEFGRIDPDGKPEYFTLGCGLQAIEHRDGVDAWFFTTDDRIGQSLELVQDAVPHSKSRLNEVLGQNGRIYRGRGDYRRAVDERLFRLGNRYTALVDLLIQLRVPQLSRDFDEKRMSAQLSEALPPLSIEVLSQVADAMQDLDEQRIQLEELRRSESGVRAFRDQYRGYLRIALKRRVGHLIAAHNQHDQALRTINDRRREFAEASQLFDSVTAACDATETDLKRATATLSTLRSRPEMDDARRLDDLRVDCTRLDAQCDRAADLTRRAVSKLSEAAAAADEQKRREESDRKRAQTQIDALLAADLPAAVSRSFHAAAAELFTERGSAKPLAAVDRALQGGRKASQTLAAKRRSLEELRGELQRQAHRQSDLESRLESDRLTLNEHAAACVQFGDEVRQRLVDWFDAATPLAGSLPARAAWLELLGLHESARVDDAQPADADDVDVSPLEAVAAAIDLAFEAASVDLGQREARLQSDRDRLTAEIAGIDARLQVLNSGEPISPQPSPYRDGSVRERRRGGPLYLLCDFVDSVPEEERANWEAALESAGLLDAWLTPDGVLESPALHDTTLIDLGEITDQNVRLTQVLRPADPLPEGVSPEAVRRVLRSIGCGKNTAASWVDRDGTWQLGHVRGAWSKSGVDYLGVAARESRRQREIRDAEREKAAAQLELDGNARLLQALQEERESVSACRRSLPSDDRFQDASAARRAAEVQCFRTRQSLEEQTRKVAQTQLAANAANERLQRDASDLGLDDWLDRLTELDAALVRFAHGVDLLRRDLDSLHRQSDALERSERVRESAEEVLHEERRTEKELKDQRTQKRAQLATLESSVGKDVQKILAEIEEQAAVASEAESRLKALRVELQQCISRKERLAGRLEESESVLERHEADRKSRIADIESFHGLGLATQALEAAGPDEVTAVELPEFPWSATRAAELARQIRTALRDTRDSDEAWNAAQNELQERFRGLEQSLLPTGVTPQIQSRDELLLVAIPYRGVSCSASELCRRLADEVTHRESLITQRERELFEQRLIGDIAGALHRNIREAHELCGRMNDEVESRPMSTGMRLKFRWHPDPEGGDELKIACESLLKKPSAMKEADRAALGRFLQTRIAQARAEEETGTWQQQMAEALDYRRWFTFDIMRETDGRWQRLTRRTHGTGSGGERAVALIIPMLAALAAYYQSADAAAPRMILMDEAFVGIDNEMRAKFMDLMVQFDLGFVMTSEREWGCYPTMPALAIYHLSTRRGVDAILATRWVWNGKGLACLDADEPPKHQEALEDVRS